MLNPEDDSVICSDTAKPRKIKPQNIVNRLIERETWGFRRPGSNIYNVKRFYQNIFPNLTVVNVEKPACFLRKFTPDGKYLIAFSFDQTSLEIYKYLGVTSALTLTYSWESDIIPNSESGVPNLVRHMIFDKLFKLKHVVNMTCTYKQLNRECSLFTNDGRYVIVGAATFIPEDRPYFYEMYRNNESLTPTQRCPLEDYTLYVVDLHNGCLSDCRDFKVDKIFLSHNQGLYLYNNTLAVLSVQHQLIHIFEVHRGKLHRLRTIGRFCCGEPPPTRQLQTDRAEPPPFREVAINTLKHRLLVFLFRRAKHLHDTFGDKLALRKFYQHFDHYRQLRMWKMQLLDDNHLLIKYSSEEVVTLKHAEPSSQPCFFVIYNIWETKVLAVYDNASEELLYLFENFCDHFRNAKANSGFQFTASPSNNMYAKLIQQRFQQTIMNAKGGGKVEATKRILAQLPISSQSFSSSPYLDLSLYSYDDKLVSVMERPKACTEYPIRFFARDSGLLKFRIFPGLQGKYLQPSSRHLVAFTFHPTDPFAISVQRINTDYIVNFHIRSAT
ncbi:DET1 homolog [Phlebotomus argentipes]|uniref:DET1 homolog n=1 Tax=Phlebotomus argentipes TaxID=94469 RepID=UPI0028935188|nr:DET1 homolog [Phlebotomus argentipes]